MQFWYDAFIIDNSEFYTKNYVKALIKNISNVFDFETGEIINQYTSKDKLEKIIKENTCYIVEIPTTWGGFAYGDLQPPPLYSWCYVIPQNDECTRFLLIGYNNYGFTETAKKDDVLQFQHPLPFVVDKDNQDLKQTIEETFIKSIKFLKDKNNKFVAPEKYPADYLYLLDKNNIYLYKRKLKKDDKIFSDENLDLEKQYYNIYFINDNGVGCLVTTNKEKEIEKKSYTYFSIENEKIFLKIKDEKEEKQKLYLIIDEKEERKLNFEFINKDEKTTSFVVKEQEINFNIKTSEKEQSNILIDKEQVNINIKKNNKDTKINCKENAIEITVENTVVLKIEKDKISIKTGDDEVVLWSKLKDIISKLENHKHPTPSGISAPSTDLAALSSIYNNCKSKSLKTT